MVKGILAVPVFSMCRFLLVFHRWPSLSPEWVEFSITCDGKRVDSLCTRLFDAIELFISSEIVIVKNNLCIKFPFIERASCIDVRY